MSVTERLMAPGDWSLTLSAETPQDTWDLLREYDDGHGAYFCHIVITPGHMPKSVGEPTIMANASYSGILRHIRGGQGKPIELSGPGVIAWLGDEDDKGKIIETAITIENGTLQDWLDAILPPSITQGTITEPGRTLSHTVIYVTPREALDFICLSLGCEYRVNPDCSIDVGPPWALFQGGDGQERVFDTFSRADGSLGNAESGQAWSTPAGTWVVDTKEAAMTTNTAPGLAIVDAGVTDVVVKAVVRSSPTGGRTSRGLLARYVDVNNYLMLRCIDIPGQAREIQLLKRQGGVEAPLSAYGGIATSNPFQWTPGEDFTIQLTIEGRILKVHKNGVLMPDLTSLLTTAEMTVFGAATNVGMFITSFAGADDDLQGRFDNFNAADPPQKPATIMMRRKGGRDPDLDALQTNDLFIDEDLDDYITRLTILGRDLSFAAAVAGADRPDPTPYRDMHNNPVEITKLVDMPPVNDALVPNMAEAMLNAVIGRRTSVGVSTDTFAVSEHASYGDTVWVFDPTRGLFDKTNQVLFRSEWIYPMRRRIYSYTWPIERGMGVYLRGRAGEIHDLSDWVEWETGTALDTNRPSEITKQELLRMGEAVQGFATPT